MVCLAMGMKLGSYNYLSSWRPVGDNRFVHQDVREEKVIVTLSQVKERIVGEG